MGFSREIYLAAFDETEKSRTRAEAGAERLKIELQDKSADLKQIDGELSRLYFEIAREVLGGNLQNNIEKLKNKSLKLTAERETVLKKMGKTPDDLLPKYSCKACNDSGYVDGKMCVCVKKRARAMAYDEINKITPIERCRFDTFKLEFYPTDEEDGVKIRDRMKRIYEFAKKYAAGFNEKSKSVFFFGETGLGKTHLTLAIVNEVIKKDCGVIYAPVSHIINDIEKQKFGGGGTETLDMVCDCDLLVLDDLGSEFNTPFSVSVIYDIINTRILSEKPTIINTNLSFDEIEKKYTTRILSRILGFYEAEEFMGRDIRVHG